LIEFFETSRKRINCSNAERCSGPGKRQKQRVSLFKPKHSKQKSKRLWRDYFFLADIFNFKSRSYACV